MANKFGIETYRKVWDDENGVSLGISFDTEGGGNIKLYTPTKKDEEFYGKLDLTIPPQQARLLAEAIFLQLQNSEGKT